MTRRRLSPSLSRALVLFTVSPISSLLGCSEDGGGGDSCALEDQDGIIGGEYTFALAIDDESFDPIVFAAQNSADVTLTLTNDGTADSGFSIDCLATPNDDGCATESCFPDSHVIEPIAPGAAETVLFQLPQVEGIYVFRAFADDDTRTGQFIVQ